jgi:diguanylate cyclase (GGDEF)-like protein/PAS domain S-box-containing protein
MTIVTYWNPIYGWEAVVEILTAIVSLITAFVLFRLTPKILAFPTITTLEKQNKALMMEKEKNLLLLNSADEGIYGLDLEGNVTFVNPTACKILGYTEAELLNKPMHAMVHHSYPDGTSYPRENCPMYGAFKYGKVNRVDNEVLWHKEGHSVPVRYTSMPMYAGDDIVGAVVTFLDISREKQARDKLEYLAQHDDLTGLPNRLYFRTNLEIYIKRHHRLKQQFALLFIDLDNFKDINDNRGHKMGDQLLCEVGKRLKQSLRDTDFIARLGGDEFATILENINNLPNLASLIKKILALFTDPFCFNEESFLINCSIGIAVYPESGVNDIDLLKNADIAMYKAKETMGNSYYIFNQHLNDETMRLQKIEEGLVSAIEKNELYLVYQPILEVKSKEIHGYEVLVRWKNEALNNPTPNEFIPIAEKSNLIFKIGNWVLNQAIKEFESIQRAKSNPELKVFINISAMQFNDVKFIQTITEALAISNLKPSCLNLEITETCAMTNVERSIQALNKICHIGVKCALDDFGTGYSSMSYLKQLPISYIKIDKSFVDDIETDEQGAVIVTAIISLARSLKLLCIAEGIENEFQYKYIQSNDCDLAQGYHFAKPAPMSEL